MKITKYSVYIPYGDKLRKKSLRFANAMAIELYNYGVEASLELILAISSQHPSKAEEVCREILKTHTIGDLNPPLFSDWENRTEFTFDEFIVQICGYIFQFSGNDLEDANFMKKLRSHVDYGKVKKLKLASNEKALEKFKNLIAAEVSQDRENLKVLVDLAGSISLDEIPYIKSDEARVAVAMSMVGVRPFGLILESLRCKPADVLRIVAAQKDIKYIKLPHDVKYASIDWQSRLGALEFLSNFSFEDLSEAMGMNRTAWERFFKYLHVFGQKSYFSKFPEVLLAAYVSVGGRIDNLNKGLEPLFLKYSRFIEATDGGSLVYRTFASRITSAVEAKDFAKIKECLSGKTNYLFRNLGSISNGITKENYKDFIDFAKSGLGKVAPGVLFSVLSIDTGSKYRIIYAKVVTTIQEANYSPVIKLLQKEVETELSKRYKLSGKVKCSADLKNKIVPFLSKNSELGRGSRFKIEESAYMYFFMHWVQNTQRTDLDHSWACIKDDGSYEEVAFWNQVNGYIKQSGDITNAPAPNGGTEYSQIDFTKIPKDIKYIVPCINVFCGESFSENKEAYAGFMFSNSEYFDLRRNHIKYGLVEPARANVPFVIDVAAKEVIIVDYNRRESLGRTVSPYIEDVKKIIAAKKRDITIGKLCKLLSGEGKELSLEIVRNKKNAWEIEPADLYTLIK